MDSPYKIKLKSLQGQEVTINRADAPDVTGTVAIVEAHGVQLKLNVHEEQSVKHIFVAFEHIRGVSFFEWEDID